MDASQIVDAVSTSLFALLGIWAAVVRRHWFLRMAAVGSVLLLALCIPAYEVVIEFGVQLAVIAGVMSLRRGRATWQPRMSVETALLAMVVVAVIAAVVGAAPHFGWNQWLRLFAIGASLGAISLLCLWIVGGRSRWRVRLPLGSLGIVAFAALIHFGTALDQAIWASRRGNALLSELAAAYSAEKFLNSLAKLAPSVALGVAILITVVSLGRASGWFEGARSSEPSPRAPRSVRMVARISLCLAFAAVAAPNFYLLYRLCTPPRPLPEIIPEDNGYDDLVAAGMIPGVDYQIVKKLNAGSMSDEQLAWLVVDLQPVYDRVDAGLAKECWATGAYVRSSPTNRNHDAIWKTLRALEVRNEGAWRRSSWRELIDLRLLSIKFGQEASRGQHAEFSFDSEAESWNVAKLARSLGAFSADECRLLIERLQSLEATREPFELKVEREEAYWCANSWTTHLRSLISELNGKDNWVADRANARQAIASTRVLIAEAALQAYWLEHRTLPPDLSALVPEYLPAVPLDPLTSRPLVYVRDEFSYRVYSVGPDLNDNGGVPLDWSWSNSDHADVVAFGPHLPPAPHWVRATVASAASRGWDWVQAAAAAAKKAAPPTAPR